MHDAKEKSDATVRPYAGAGLMYAEVILPLPLRATFTHRIPQELDGKVSIGSRIIDAVRTQKLYTAIVCGLSPIAPEDMQIKDVMTVLDPGR